MELQGEQWVLASREAVWRALNDPLVLAKCVPGCEEMRRVSDTEIEARLLTKIGPVRAHFSGRILMHDVVPPQSCRIAFEGSGGAAGMAKGESKVTLAEDNGSTRLSYTVEAAVGGKLGQIGGRLINASARKMADEFFQALNEQLAPNAPPAPAAPASDTVAAAAPARLAAPTVAASPAGGPVWANEFQRILWLAIGIGVGWLACRAFSV